MNTSRCARLIVLALLAAAGGRPLAAQEIINAASLAGRVVDPQNAVVAGAFVTARRVETNVVTSTSTDRDGRFRLAYLPVGTYDVTVGATGFNTLTRTLTLTVGSAFNEVFSLTVGGVDTSVTVTARAPLLDGARTQSASTVLQTELRNLPLNGRNSVDIALLSPDVAPANVASTQLFSETSAVPGPGLSVAGQRNLSNSFIVDGLSANDDAAGLTGMPYGVDAIEQMQVVTSGGQAEFGRALAGYVNVVTRSGTNRLMGDAYDYARDDRLNAANALTGTALPMDQNQYGVSSGGPFVRDRTFFFGNVEQRTLHQSGLTTIAPGDASAINVRLAGLGYPGSPVVTGIYPNPVSSTNAVGKIDQHVSGRDTMSARYTLYHVTSTNSRGAGALGAPSASAGLENLDQSAAFNNVATLSARTVMETRAQIAFSDLNAPPADPAGPAVSISGAAVFGTLSISPTRRRNTLFELANSMSHQAGAHAVRAGIDVLINDDAITFPRAVRGSYTFSSLDNFLAGTYNTAGFSQTFGASSVSQTNPNVGVFAQDQWVLAHGLTLSAGVRYDLQFLQTITTDRNNVSPRVGLAWTPGGSSRTVLRASGGVYYDRVPLRALANALLSADNTADVSRLRQVAISLSPGQAGAPAFPGILGAPVPSVTLPNLTTMERGIENAHSRQAGIEIERQLGRAATISAGYEYLRGLDLIAAINQNVAACTASGTNNGCRPHPEYGNDSQYSPVGASSYHGLHVSFQQRPGRWGYYRVNYTLSKAMNNVGEFFFSAPIDPFDISRDWGRSDDDQRHRLVVNGAWNWPQEPGNTWWQRLTHGFQVSGLLQAYSALPLNVVSGVTTIQGTAARPLIGAATSGPPDVRSATFIVRNAGQGPSFFSISVRGSRTFNVTGRIQLEALIDVFNVTNHVNAVTLNGNFGTGSYPSSPSAAFGRVTAVGESRSAQIGLRAHF